MKDRNMHIQAGLNLCGQVLEHPFRAKAATNKQNLKREKKRNREDRLQKAGAEYAML
jgi:hypothetical protein